MFFKVLYIDSKNLETLHYIILNSNFVIDKKNEIEQIIFN